TAHRRSADRRLPRPKFPELAEEKTHRGALDGMRALVLALVALCLSASAALAQPQQQRGGRPHWAELTAEQQRVLAPLKVDWESLDRDRKLTWVGIAKRYPKL